MWIASVNVELSFRRAKFYRPRMLRILVIIKEEEENRKCMIKLFFVVYCRVPENRRIIFFSDVHCFPGKRENIYIKNILVVIFGRKKVKERPPASSLKENGHIIVCSSCS